MQVFKVYDALKKIGTRRVHVSAKKLDSHFVFSWKELNNEDDMGQLQYFITYYNIIAK
jgi:hypothetical protein